MRILSIIAEYNPFHNGHKYHIEQSIKESKATHTIAIISGSFVQRGEPSIINKWDKAKVAIENGVDLVIELPFLYSVQTAELFAYGAIEILDSLNIVDYIAFGAEYSDLKELQSIAKIFLEEPKGYRENLLLELKKGFSYPKARELAIKEYINNNNIPIANISLILNESNNILAIEYLKALYKLQSNIQPIIIKRIGNNYKDKNINLNNRYSSATSIRNHIFSNKDINVLKQFLPKESYYILENNLKQLNNLNLYIDLLNYIIINFNYKDMDQYMDMTVDLKNRLLNINSFFQSSEEMVKSLSTKRYTETRIQRTFIHLLSNLTKDTIFQSYKNRANYIRILGSNKKGFEIINRITNNSEVKVINRFSQTKDIKDANILNFLKFEEKATNLYFLPLNKKNRNLDYLISPYIKKE